MFLRSELFSFVPLFLCDVILFPMNWKIMISLIRFLDTTLGKEPHWYTLVRTF